jgi:glycosyltransferase involved in cell wall biosynthesis
VAKLLPKKRPLDLLAAARRCEIPLNILIIGDGPLRSEVERAARQLHAARVLGFVNQRELGLWYGLSDAIVLPSDYEPWGLVINEAMATGAVPVVSDAVGCAEDLVHPDSGIVFPVGDIDAIAAALKYLGESPGRLAAMRLAARAVVDDYTIERTARGIERAAVLAAEGRG